jgi:AmmeMemoRadiSam system protein B/AmmeMemoRadiSam system protein A
MHKFILCLFLLLFSFNCKGRSEMVRKPAVAGSFYPMDSSKLSSTIDNYLKQADVEIKEEIIGAISPHAGYVYSGQTAAFVYKALKNKEKKLVILLGPSHHYYVKGFSVYDEGKWETPLGTVSIDEDFASKLKSHSELINNDKIAHTEEHSLEVQLPFLQKTFKDFKIVPIVFNTDQPSLLEILANALSKELLNRKDWVIVVSSDLYHGYNYNEAKAATDKVDEYIKNFDYIGLLEYDRAMREAGVCAACGCSAIAVLLKVMNNLGATEVKLLEKTTSGDVTGEKSGYVVGYGAWIFTIGKTKKETTQKSEARFDFTLTSKDKEKLLTIARETITQYVKNNKIPTFQVESEVLQKKCGAFVTLKEHGDLRGCIGLIVAEKPLYLAVRDMAIAAATEDPRFSPLEPSEIDKIEIEISVLTPMQKVNNIDEIEVGRDGLMIKRGWMSGLLLPQVPVEQGWDKKTFLEHTCYKAGLPSDAWKSSDLWKFQAIVFGEKD